MKILAVVKFNDDEAYVLDEIPKLLYEKRDNLLIGYDKDKILYKSFYYEKPTERWKAFAGAEFDLELTNGDIEHCYGQWWDGAVDKASKILNIDIVGCTIESIKKLKECYVFCGYYCDYEKMKALREQYKGKIYEYYEYQNELKKQQ